MKIMIIIMLFIFSLFAKDFYLQKEVETNFKWFNSCEICIEGIVYILINERGIAPLINKNTFKYETCEEFEREKGIKKTDWIKER
jgi:hypothetical protein